MTPKTQKELQSERTQRRLVDAAMRLFARKGFFATTIADLAEATGLTKGALYHHFENKEALFFAVLDASREDFRRAVVRDVLKAQGAMNRLAALFDNHTRLLAENEVFCLVLGGLVLEMDGANPAFLSALKRLYADLTDFFERIIRKGQANGEIRGNLDSRLLALSIVAMLEGSAIPWILNREQVDFAAMMSTMKDAFLSGLQT